MVKLEIDDTVKIIGSTIVGSDDKATPIPIGTVCRINSIDCVNGVEYFSVSGVSSEDKVYGEFIYTREALEKGRMIWVKEEE